MIKKQAKYSESCVLFDLHREALQVMKAEMEGKLVGLERAVIDTR